MKSRLLATFWLKIVFFFLWNNIHRQIVKNTIRNMHYESKYGNFFTMLTCESSTISILNYCIMFKTLWTWFEVFRNTIIVQISSDSDSLNSFIHSFFWQTNRTDLSDKFLSSDMCGWRTEAVDNLYLCVVN